MKKLMIAAAIVCVAAVSQAASADWAWSTNTGVLKDGYKKSESLSGSKYSPVKMPSMTTYLFLASTATATTSKEDLNATLTALRAGTAVTSVSGYTGQSTQTDADGKITNDNAVRFTYDAGKPVNESAFFYEVVVVDNFAFISGLAGATTAAATKEGTIITAPGPSTGLKDDTLKGSWTAGGWYKISDATPTPEPTSGMLLLLGVAGLALRRKQK